MSQRYGSHTPVLAPCAEPGNLPESIVHLTKHIQHSIVPLGFTMKLHYTSARFVVRPRPQAIEEVKL
jgi:hypothetical protein